jgi:hypothetical protein
MDGLSERTVHKSSFLEDFINEFMTNERGKLIELPSSCVKQLLGKGFSLKERFLFTLMFHIIIGATYPSYVNLITIRVLEERNLYFSKAF